MGYVNLPSAYTEKILSIKFESLLELTLFLDHPTLQAVAEKLEISQPTLSKHLAKLEKDIGFQLFQHDYKLTLTPAGRRFAVYATSILEHFIRSVQECAEQVGQAPSFLRIQENDLTFAGQESFNRILNRFMSMHEGYDFTLIAKSPHDVDWVLQEGIMDICFWNEFGDIEEIIARYRKKGVGLLYLSSERVIVWAKRNHRIFLNDSIRAADVSHERIMTMSSPRSPQDMSLSERLFKTPEYQKLPLKRDVRTAEKRATFLMMDPRESIYLLPESFSHIPYIYERTSMAWRPIDDGTAIHHMFLAYDIYSENRCVKEFIDYFIGESS